MPSDYVIISLRNTWLWMPLWFDQPLRWCLGIWSCKL